jgi:hypothetical protein
MKFKGGPLSGKRYTEKFKIATVKQLTEGGHSGGEDARPSRHDDQMPVRLEGQVRSVSNCLSRKEA